MSYLVPKQTSYNAPANFLANEHYAALPGGVTIDYSTVPTAEVNGVVKRILAAGRTLGKITASGKYGPYDNGLSDGREVGKGINFHEVDCTDGDITASLVVHGLVKEAALPVAPDSGFKADCPAIIFV